MVFACLNRSRPLSHWVDVVPCVSDPRCDVLSGDVFHRNNEGFVESFASNRVEATQGLFDFGPYLFDRVELWRVRREEEHFCARVSYHPENIGIFVCAEVVHNDDIARTEVLCELLSDESVEHLRVGSGVNRHESSKACSDEGPLEVSIEQIEAV